MLSKTFKLRHALFGLQHDCPRDTDQAESLSCELSVVAKLAKLLSDVHVDEIAFPCCPKTAHNQDTMAVSLVADITPGQADAYLVFSGICTEDRFQMPFAQLCRELRVRCKRRHVPCHPFTIHWQSSYQSPDRWQRGLYSELVVGCWMTFACWLAGSTG